MAFGAMSCRVCVRYRTGRAATQHRQVLITSQRRVNTLNARCLAQVHLVRGEAACEAQICGWPLLLNKLGVGE
eukprot:7388161-Prymnesium_polylepis.1